MIDKNSRMYCCWLSYREIKNSNYKEYLENVVISYRSQIVEYALCELKKAFEQFTI